MTDDQPANRLSELPPETREFLSQLSPEDIATFKNGLPIIRAIVGFSKVGRWLAIAALSLLAAAVLIGESILKIISWFKLPQT